MDDWCTKTHSDSGLIKLVLNSELTIHSAEETIISYLESKGFEPNKKIIVAGNSVHVDKQFIEREMPNLCRYLHYRLIDVSSIKELAKRWYPLLPPFKKKETHRALDDILESIDELKYYRVNIFKKGP